MAHLPLVGPDNVASPASVSASECINLYPEVIDSPEDRTKNVAVLKKRPGAHQIIDLGGANRIRALFSCQSTSGGGRLFVLAGNLLKEIGQNTYAHGNPSTGAGSTISSNALPAGISLPGTDTAYIIGNGHQLCIVADNTVYYDNGAGPILARFLLSGTATYAAGTLTWQAGDQFTAAMAGRVISLNGDLYTVSAYTNATHVSITGAPAIPGTKAGVCTLWYEGQVYGVSGDNFTSEMEGKPIVIGGTTYTVKTVSTSNALQLVETDNASVSTAAVWGTLSANLLYECDGGAIVDGLSVCYVGSTAFVNRTWGGTPDLGRQVTFSDPDDFSIWRPSNFFTKQGNPDYIQRVVSEGNLVVVVGTEESELWQMDPSTGNPVPLPNGSAKRGTVARHTVVSRDGSIYYLGGNPDGGFVAYRVRGFTPQRISTLAVEKAWNTGLALSSALTANGYVLGGHEIYVVHFPTGGTVLSWAYDATASEQLGYSVWHQLAGWNPVGGTLGTGDFTAYPYHHHTYIGEWGNGMHVVGGPASGKLYELSTDYGDDAGDAIHWRRAIPYRYAGGDRVFEGPMELITSKPRPTITRDKSIDDAVTWQNARAITSGRLRWRRNGASRDLIWRFYGAGTDPLALIDLVAEEKAGQ